MTNSKKGLTCYYWSDRNRCKFSAEECLYAHHYTGSVAAPPKPAIKTGQRKRIPDDLISLTSRMDDLEDEKPPPVAGYEPGGQRRVNAQPEQPADPAIAGSLRSAISMDEDFAFIKNLLTSESPSVVRESLSLGKHAVAAIFSAVDRSRTDILRLIINHGVDPNARRRSSGIPVLASAIFQNNASAVVSLTILLEMGADPYVIPRDLWDDDTSSVDPQVLQDEASKSRWCDDANRNLLAKCFNLTIKHCLNEATKKYSTLRDEPKPNSNLVNVEFSSHLFTGQAVAFNHVNDYLRCHWLCGKREPLVFAFVGPAGHGKTELARRIGTIQQLESIVGTSSQATSIADEEELAGARNNQFIRTPDSVNVVWIDGSKKIDAHLLTSLLSGSNKGGSNHAQNVFIIAITETDYTVDFYHHLRSVLTDSSDADLLETYEFVMKKELRKLYGPSVAGRVACVVPFVPFSKKEITLLAHKLILDAAEELTKSCLLTPGPNCGKNVSFTVDVDDAVCEYIGQSSYDVSIGARSIEQAVFSKVELRMVEEYTKVYPTTMHLAERTRVTTHRPLNFVIRLNHNKSLSVVLE